MTDLGDLCRELETTWHRDIPLAAAIDLGVAAYDGEVLRVQAPFAPNRNVHGTAFAGSLFSVCVLTGWGAVWLALRRIGLDGRIVVSDSRIRYRRAVAGDIACSCAMHDLTAGLAPLRSEGRASVPIVCTIDHLQRRAITFEGTYVVHGGHGR